MKNKILLLSILAASALCLTSCHDDIYYMISQEEKLETNGISGTINSIVHFGVPLYPHRTEASNKKNRMKSSSISPNPVQTKQWTKMPVPSDSSSTFTEGKYVYQARRQTGNYLYGIRG